MVNYNETTSSLEENGIVKGYIAATSQGTYRKYNEDRLAIVLKINNDSEKSDPTFRGSFFGLFDGHGGSNCSDYLRDNLHKFIISNIYFPDKPKKAIM